MLVLGKVAPSLTSTELIRGIGDGEKGGMGWGKREITYLITIGMSSPSSRCYHHDDSSIKMGSEGSHFNVSLIIRDSHETVHRPQREPKMGFKVLLSFLPLFCEVTFSHDIPYEQVDEFY